MNVIINFTNKNSEFFFKFRFCQKKQFQEFSEMQVSQIYSLLFFSVFSSSDLLATSEQPTLIMGTYFFMWMSDRKCSIRWSPLNDLVSFKGKGQPTLIMGTYCFICIFDMKCSIRWSARNDLVSFRGTKLISVGGRALYTKGPLILLRSCVPEGIYIFFKIIE